MGPHLRPALPRNSWLVYHGALSLSKSTFYLHHLDYNVEEAVLESENNAQDGHCSILVAPYKAFIVALIIDHLQIYFYDRALHEELLPIF